MKSLTFSRTIWKRLAQSISVGLLILISGWVGPFASENSRAWDVRVAEPQAGFIYVQPSPAQIEAGESITVEIWVDDVAEYYGIELKARFNPDRVIVPSGNCTPLWDVFDAGSHLIFNNSVDNEAGEVTYVVLNLNPAEPFTGSGRICSITFEGVENGITTLEIYHAKASDRDATPLWPEQGIAPAIWVGEVEQVFLPAIR